MSAATLPESGLDWSTRCSRERLAHMTAALDRRFVARRHVDYGRVAAPCVRLPDAARFLFSGARLRRPLQTPLSRAPSRGGRRAPRVHRLSLETRRTPRWRSAASRPDRASPRARPPRGRPARRKARGEGQWALGPPGAAQPERADQEGRRPAQRPRPDREHLRPRRLRLDRPGGPARTFSLVGPLHPAQGRVSTAAVRPCWSRTSSRTSSSCSGSGSTAGSSTWPSCG